MLGFDPPLPIDAVLADVAAGLASGTRLVVVAPPGAGKTTRIPLFLLGEAWAAGKRIIVLEPRRLAGAAHGSEPRGARRRNSRPAHAV